MNEEELKKDQLPQILHVKDLQVLLSISHNTAYELVRSGKIRSIRIGRTYKIKNIAMTQYTFYFTNSLFLPGFQNPKIFMKPYIEAIICAIQSENGYKYAEEPSLPHQYIPDCSSFFLHPNTFLSLTSYIPTYHSFLETTLSIKKV